MILQVKQSGYINNPFYHPSVQYSIPAYGLLYNGYVVVDERGLAPTGWRLPTWSQLNFLWDAEGMKEVGTEHWNTDNGTNELKLSLVGSGCRDDGTGEFFGVKDICFLYDNTGSGYLKMYDDLGFNNASGWEPGPFGIAVRCVRDTLDGWTENETVLDYDGNLYHTTKIDIYWHTTKLDTQVWLAENLAVTHYNNGDIIPEVTDTDEWLSTTTGALCAYNNDWSGVFKH